MNALNWILLISLLVVILAWWLNSHYLIYRRIEYYLNNSGLGKEPETPKDTGREGKF